uniref:Toll5 n=1 Tax=Sinohyriopsis cumingii TaxID=165450 RepID=A0A2R3ZQC1_SINCU|nr:Toll5 [Sinohyriopsis cumingii]
MQRVRRDSILLYTASNSMDKKIAVAMYWLVGLNLAATYMTLHVTTSGASCNQSNATVCKCSEDSEKRLVVDCSHSTLTEVPELPRNAVILILSHNELQVLRNGTFSTLSQLLYLTLVSNYIRVIELDAFEGLENLQELILDSNILPLSAQVFPKGVFRHLTNLSHLSMQNIIKDISQNLSYPDDAFGDLTSLTTLKIDGILHPIFGFGFNKLTKLRVLNFTPKKCFLNTLSNETFLHLMSLTHLDINGCHIESIQPGTFVPLHKLEYLDMSNNEKLGMDGFFNATFGLQNSSISILKARKLSPTFHIGVFVKNNIFKFLQNTNIRELYADSNNFQIVENGWANYYPSSLEIFSVRDNRFSFGLYILDLTRCSGMKILYVDQQNTAHSPFPLSDKMITVEKNAEDASFTSDSEYEQMKKMLFRRDAVLKENFQYNFSIGVAATQPHEIHLNKIKQRRDSFRQVIEQTSSLTSTRASGKEKDSAVSSENTYSVGFSFRLPPDLQEFYLQSSNLRYDIKEFNFLNNSLQTLNLSGNALFKWTGPIVGLNNLQVLDLSNNLCSDIGKHFFENFNSLEILFIGHNLLGYVIEEDIDGEIFGNLKSLKRLDISDNRISFIPSKFFLGLLNLEIFDVSKNFLQTVDFEINHMKKISQLDFQQNLLSLIPANIRSHLSDVKSNNISIYLEGNPLKCDCDALDFLKWIDNEKSQIMFVNIYNNTCNFNGIIRSFRNLAILINDLDKKCANYTAVILIASICFAVFIIITVIGLMYRYRWKLRYFYYMTKRRYRGYTSLDETTSDNYQYDAFLSYAETNLRLVRFTLLSKLEDEGLHICIHHRDFLPGKAVSANIANAIHCSRKTVVLLDDDFLSSYWCMYELNIARMESLYSRRGEDILVLVVKEGIDKSKLPLELLDLIHRNTYIELPQDLQVIDTSGICGRIKDAILG